MFVKLIYILQAYYTEVFELFDKDITVVNKYLDSKTRTKKYGIYHLKGFWNSRQTIKLSNLELLNSNSYSALILMTESGYVKPKEYKGDSETWTLKPDDYLIKGKIESFNSLNELENYEYMKITDASIKDYCSDDMKHYMVSGE